MLVLSATKLYVFEFRELLELKWRHNRTLKPDIDAIARHCARRPGAFRNYMTQSSRRVA
jgi:hypothetical protein